MLTKNKVLTWLQEHPIATIATLSTDHTPQMAVVYTYVDKDYYCYFVTKEQTRKYYNLYKNKTISVAWFDEQGLITCEMNGEAHIVHEGEGVAVAVTYLQEAMINQKAEYWTPPVGQVEGTKYAVFRILPYQVSYTDYSSATKRNPKPKRLAFQP